MYQFLGHPVLLVKMEKTEKMVRLVHQVPPVLEEEMAHQVL